MSTSVVLPINSLNQQSSELSVSIQQQHLQLRQQQQLINDVISPNYLVEDEVYGVIELPKPIEEIVHHPLFQRLKKVKQLGVLALINDKFDHSRYDHCIGTYKSAQDHLNALKRNSNYEPELPKWCRQSVEIAALLHDIGHGPFSHSWEAACDGRFDVGSFEYNTTDHIMHEVNGIVCVDRIFQDVKNEELISLRDDHNGRGLQLIKALILGNSEMLSFPMMGHGYIFDIVHNSRCGLDVDKWDYLRRDNKRLQILTEDQMDFDSVFLKSRISPDGQRIEYRYDDYHLIYKLFEARWILHLYAYRAPKTLAFHTLLCQILQRCQGHLLNIGGDSEEWAEFTDETVLKMIDSDPQAVFLHKPDHWFEISVDNDSNDDSIIRVNNIKPGPGKDMCPDEFYPLYGEKSKKQNIVRQMTSTTISGHFKLS